EAIENHRDRAVVLGSRHAPRVVLARDEPALAVARVAVGVVGGAPEHGDGARLFVPTHDAVVGNVAPQEIATVAEPHGALGPAESGRQPLHRRIVDPKPREALIQDLHRRIGIPADRSLAHATSHVATQNRPRSSYARPRARGPSASRSSGSSTKFFTIS